MNIRKISNETKVDLEKFEKETNLSVSVCKALQVSDKTFISVAISLT